jgi:hypothetical protein
MFDLILKVWVLLIALVAMGLIAWCIYGKANI